MMADLTAYAGRWVALVGDLVAGVGYSPAEAKRLARHNRPKERVTLRFVEASGGEPLLLPPLLAELQPLFLNLDMPIYLVGGAVRDAVMGSASHDLDFVTPRKAISLAFQIANKLGKPAYVLDKERDAGRVVLHEAGAWLDFTRFRGEDLAADLAARDFTINAMAMPATAVTDASIIDPYGGLQDIAARQIRLVNPQALEQDPVRALRAVRQGLAFDFRLTEETKTAVTAAAPLLHKTSTERIRDELVKLLETAVPHKAVGQMAALGLLPELLPEIAALASVEQSPPHHEPVLAHTIAVLEWVAALETAVLDQQPAADAPLKQAQTALRPFVDGLRTHFGRELDAGLNGRLLLHLDALFHDAGKLSTRTVDEEGRIRFLGHDKAGAEVAAVRLRALKFSRQAIKQVETAVAHHMRPFSLAQTGKPLSRRAIFRYFRAAGETGLDVGLLALADHLATYGGMGDTAVWEHLLAVVAELFRHYFHLFTETVAPEMLVNGRDLMEELNLPSGPEIGRLLRLVQEAQAAGSLHTRAEALAFARAARQ